jgi:hypothetical protein
MQEGRYAAACGTLAGAAMSAARRSYLVSGLGGLLVAGGLFLLPISIFSALTFMVGGYGTANAGVSGALLVVFGPAATMLAGIGLWRRWRWAWVYVVLLALAVLALQIVGWWRGPTPQYNYVSASGVPTTVLASEAQYSLPLLLACVVVPALLVLPRVRAEFFAARPIARRDAPPAGTARAKSDRQAAEAARGWRVGHEGRDGLYYEERRDGRWQRLDIDGEMLLGETHHAVYLASPGRWRHYPDWARDRRDEIVARIRSEFRVPEYDYRGELGGVPVARQRPRRSAEADGSSRTALWGVAIGLLLFAGVMAWLVWHGLDGGETWWPAKYSGARRIVTRLADPAMYWTALALYTALGFASLGLLGWGYRVIRRTR